MVVFTCGHCGESIQKPKVEKHYLTKCRNKNPNLSCMDCFKDFLGNDYEAHVKCITEEERYSAKGFVAKEKKGEKIQNMWKDSLQALWEEQKDIAGPLRNMIEKICKMPNVPRKKPKFVNFAKSAFRCNDKDIEKIWDLLLAKLDTLAKNNDNKQPATANNKIDQQETQQNEQENENIENNDTIEKNGEPDSNAVDEITEQSNKNGLSNETEKKLSRRQRQKEKRLLKYEAELQSAIKGIDIEEETKVPTGKKTKKNKNRTESTNSDGQPKVDSATGNEKGKNKKRKRLDTANVNQELKENSTDNVANEPLEKKKEKQKKQKVGEAESLCLHDQNVAKNEEIEVKNEFENRMEKQMQVLIKEMSRMRVELEYQKQIMPRNLRQSLEKILDEKLEPLFILNKKILTYKRNKKNKAKKIQNLPMGHEVTKLGQIKCGQETNVEDEGGETKAHIIESHSSNSQVEIM